MTDPSSTVTIDITVNAKPDGSVTRRPIPEYGTQEWDDMIREIEAKIKTGTGQ